MNEIIKQLGLDETEAKIYLALLQLGPSSVTEITKTAEVTRTLGYHVLEKLSWNGLVNLISHKNKKMIFSAQHPQAVVRYLKNKKQKIEKEIDTTEQVLPKLISLYKIGDKPTIRYQEGPQGVISLFEESLESKTEVLSILDVESWQNSDFWNWAKSYNRERNKKKIKERILILDTPAGRKWLKEYKGSNKYNLYRWISRTDAINLLQFGGELNVYDNKVMIAILKESKRMGIIIESHILANILKAMFELAWQAGVPAKKKKK